MSDLIERLLEGVIEYDRRWSGDTHADLGGSVDYEKTHLLMGEAADEIERLRAELASMKTTAFQAQEMAKEICATNDKLRGLLKESRSYIVPAGALSNIAADLVIRIDKTLGDDNGFPH